VSLRRLFTFKRGRGPRRSAQTRTLDNHAHYDQKDLHVLFHWTGSISSDKSRSIESDLDLKKNVTIINCDLMILQTVCCYHMCSFKLKMYQNHFCPGLRFAPHWKSLRRLPRSRNLQERGPLPTSLLFNVFGVSTGGHVSTAGPGSEGILRWLWSFGSLIDLTTCRYSTYLAR